VLAVADPLAPVVCVREVGDCRYAFVVRVAPGRPEREPDRRRSSVLRVGAVEGRVLDVCRF
jgi:hypothetical protein